MKKVCIISFALFTALLCILTAGCVYPEEDTSLRPQGSVEFIEGKTVFVTILVDADDQNRLDSELPYIQYAQKSATDYIMNQAYLCGKKSEIIVWGSEHEDLKYEVSYGGDVTDATLESEKSDEYYNWLNGVIEKFPIDEIKTAYNTDSIGFVVIMDLPGRSYAHPYYSNAYGSGYYESIVVFAYDDSTGDRESLATYTHEMMHLFGAIDLYEPNQFDGVTEEVCDYIEEKYPNELMFTVYNPDGTSDYEKINQYLSEITLMMTGLAGDEGVVEMFPTLKREYTAAFPSFAAEAE